MNRKQKLDSSKLSVGDIVRINRDIYLNKWLEHGGQGLIVRIGDNEGQPIYHVNIEGVQYSFVRSEIVPLQG